MATPTPPPPPRRRYGVGYALAPKKQQSFIQPSLVSLAASRGIDLVPVDPSLPLSSQGPFDLLIHKLSGSHWLSELQEFSRRYPAVPIVDHPNAIERLHNRLSMLEVVSDLQIPGQDPLAPPSTFGIPKQVVIYDAAELSDPATLQSLEFPVIAKPLVADGSEKSHKMSLLYGPNGFGQLKPPLVLQEFVNHGGVIFKVYVVGDYVQCVKRRSLPDVPDASKRPPEGASVSFSQVSNMTASRDGSYTEAELDDAVMPRTAFVTEIARGLGKAMGLHLFNFDVIRDAKVGNHYLVIDINYFPGYAKMPSYETVITDFFWKILHENERSQAGESGEGFASLSEALGDNVAQEDGICEDGNGKGKKIVVCNPNDTGRDDTSAELDNVGG